MSVTLVDAAGARHRGLSVELTMPLRGNWTAHVETGDDVAVTGAVTVELARDDAAGVDLFSGTVRHGGTWAGRSEVVVVGGAGGLLGMLEPRHYAPRGADVPADLLAQDIAREAGETLAPGVADLLGTRTVGQWTRARLPAGVALGMLADALGLAWRVLDTGQIWIGEETWPTASPEDLGRRTEQRPDARVVQVAPARATLRPGVVAFEQRVHRVTYTGGRAELSYGEADRDETAGAIRALLPPAVYGLSVGARVVQQHEDDTLDLALDDGRLPALRRVPFRAGIPGARILFDQGERMRVSFENGSPGGAYAHGCDQRPASLRGVAREGDAVDLGWWLIVGDDAHGQILIQTTEGTPRAFRLQGTISSGSPDVKIR